MTPVLDAQPDSNEENYNSFFTRARCIVERCNGLLKMRFCCLLKDRVLHYRPNTASKIINTCDVLHNMILNDGVDVTIFADLINDGLIENDPYLDDPNNGEAGRAAQDNLIMRFYS